MNRTLQSVVSLFLAVLVSATSVLGQLPTWRGTYGYQEYPRSGERYITDEFGVVRMYVNIWGHVNSPGSHLVYDGIDLATLLSIVGGPKTGANLKKIRLFRDEPDGDGKLVYTIDMEKFLKTGDRSGFVDVLPNDTYVVPQTTASFVLSNIGLLNTFLAILNVYYQVLIRQSVAK